MAKPIKPLSEQIEEYKLKFEARKQHVQWFKDNPQPPYKLEMFQGQVVANLDYQKWKYDLDELWKDLTSKGYKGEHWNWDESWDGQLIKDVTALEQAGFTIVSFSRKRKVTLKPNKATNRVTILKMIESADIDQNWYSISFKPTLSIYWKGRSSSWKY